MPNCGRSGRLDCHRELSLVKERRLCYQHCRRFPFRKMDSFRYSVALIFILVLPPLLIFWMVVHPLIHFWRRLGLRLTYGILISAMLAAAGALFLIRKPLLSVDYGNDNALLITGSVCLALSIFLKLKVSRKISFTQIVGVPEIDPQGHPGELLITGIYSRIRHPRYVQVILGLAGGALMANHPASYLATALWLPGVWIIVRLEEKELCHRFGAAYEEYRRKVPAFIPGF